MSFKPIKFFGLLSSLLLATCGTDARAEYSASSLSSAGPLQEQSTAITSDLVVSDEAFFMTEPTGEIVLAHEEAVLAHEIDFIENKRELSSTIEEPVLQIKPLPTVEEPTPQAEAYRFSNEVPASRSDFPHAPFLIGDSGSPDFGEAIYWSPSRPDSHAPISVMGEHTHEKGEFMLSYRYMYMDMDGNRSGTDSLSTADVLQEFPVAPQRMTMQMHMLGAMYAPTDDLTLMTMLPYVTKEMDHVTRMGREFTTNSEGIGDVQFGGLYKVLDQSRQRIHLNLALSVPTGSIEERDATPMGPDQILPYPMQIGSGTFDIHPGITYLGQSGRWSWGSQATGTIRLGENNNGYRQGNRFNLTGWGARSWTDWFSTSLRLGGRAWGDYGGEDDRLNPNMIPTADPDRRAGTQLDVGLGLNFYVPEGGLKGSRFALEFNLPVYRSLSGPQLETDFSATAGLQTVF